MILFNFRNLLDKYGQTKNVTTLIGIWVYFEKNILNNNVFAFRF